MTNSDYYQLLGIERGADKAEIKRAYYSRVKLYSPERDPERFMELRAAYEFLSDDGNRADYDKYAVLPKKEAEIAMEASRLLRDDRYEEAIKLLKNHKKNDALAFLLTEAYIENGNSGYGVKLAEDLLKRKPDDPARHALLTDAYRCRGYSQKALHTIEEALQKYPGNPEVLSKYLWLSHEQKIPLPPDIIDRVEQAADKLKYYYFEVFSIIIGRCLRRDEMDPVPSLYSHYADGLTAAKTLNTNQFSTAVHMTAELVYVDSCLKTAERLAYFLENSKYRSIDHKPFLDKIKIVLELAKIEDTKAFNEDFIGYLYILSDDESMERNDADKFEFEYYFVNIAERLRPSLIKLRDRYPRLFEMNAEFFQELINPARMRKLRARYEKRWKQRQKNMPQSTPQSIDSLVDTLMDAFGELPPKEKKNFTNELLEMRKEYNDIYDEDAVEDADLFDGYEPAEEPYVREERKVGRNEFCPCGSGKKYKHCCGRAGARAANQ
ncbi:MAG: DnaJ domain-containing protein [Clostridiales bacterium]|jgi:hypothetical protein|nr:DnaJ domain-containing protein [Clostridiales bacterium]